jgi:hypothetical protein
MGSLYKISLQFALYELFIYKKLGFIQILFNLQIYYLLR